MKAHALLGSDTLHRVDEQFPGNAFIIMGIEIARTHHERWDGTGYPNGLTGDRIPLSGRILAIGDVYDALTSKRCYKKPFSHEESMEIMINEKGKHFDPDLVEALERAEDRFVAIRKQFTDSEKALSV